jgi:hypothetical protein
VPLFESQALRCLLELRYFTSFEWHTVGQLRTQFTTHDQALQNMLGRAQDGARLKVEWPRLVRNNLKIIFLDDFDLRILSKTLGNKAFACGRGSEACASK